MKIAKTTLHIVATIGLLVVSFMEARDGKPILATLTLILASLNLTSYYLSDISDKLDKL